MRLHPAGRRSTSSVHFFSPLLDFVFPPLCWGCDEEIESGLICGSCSHLLSTGELDVCPGCGRPCGSASQGCGRCAIQFSLDRVRALGSYRVPYLNLVHALKYNGKTALADVVGGFLAMLALQDTALAGCDIVCAVPLHPARRRERGYNQSELLARVVAEQIRKPLVDAVVRCRNTPSQTRCFSDEARQQNLKNAFAARKGVVPTGARVLLIDDVMTSGATLDAVSQQLLRAGASAVVGLVVAAAGSPREQVQKAVSKDCRGQPGIWLRRLASLARLALD